VLREAFGPVIKRLAENGIDLTRQPIEVAPIAHYHMGGVRVETDMRTSVPHLFAAGEAVGGANGANRLSGNAITEAFTFGQRAGERGAALAAGTRMLAVAPSPALSLRKTEVNPAAEIASLQALMHSHVGPLRTRPGLEKALAEIMALAPLCAQPGAPRSGLDAEWIDLHDLRNMRLVAECVARAALLREESRGAHQRDDFAQTSEAWRRHQTIRLADEQVQIASQA
jgi:succinate dehydrogenase / fumarate reductase, flavoprotein subunit